MFSTKLRINRSSFVISTVHLSRQSNPGILAPHVKYPHSFGSIDLMGAKGHQINSILDNAYRNFAQGLGCVCKKNNPLLFRHGSNFLNRLYYSRFIVCIHHRN